MKKSTVIGLLLLVLLFIWSMTISTNRAQQQAVEKSKTEQAAPARNSSLSVPELSVLDSSRLVPATLAPAKAKEPEIARDSAISDSAKGSAPIARKKIRVENEHFSVVFDNLGAKISSIVVKALPDSAGNFPEIIGDTALGALGLKVDNVDLSGQLFALPENAPDSIFVEGDTSLVFTFADPNGNKVIRRYGFTKSGVSIGQTVSFEGFKPNDYEILWQGGMKETEVFPKGRSFGGGSYFFSEVVFNDMYSVEREAVRGKETFNAKDGKILWAGMRRKYVALSLIHI